MPTFSIGQLAKRAGVAIDTVRYYERNQLLIRRVGSSPATAATARRSSSDCGSSVVPRRLDSR